MRYAHLILSVCFVLCTIFVLIGDSFLRSYLNFQIYLFYLFYFYVVVYASILVF
jgi:hypothetical protein